MHSTMCTFYYVCAGAVENELSSFYCSARSGHGKNNLCKSQISNRRIVVIGALTFLGSRMIPRLLLDDTYDDVIAVARDGDITAGDELLWYRKDQLFQHHGISVKFVNLSNTTQLKRTISGSKDRKRIKPSTLLYFVPGIEDEELKYSEQGVNVNDALSMHLKEFVMILEYLRQTSPCTEVVLVTKSHDNHMTSHQSHMTVQQTWMRTFELMLSTYHSLYHLPITIFRVGGAHGSWSHAALKLADFANEQGHTLSTDEWRQLLSNFCWYIEDVTRSLYRVLNMQTDCLVVDLGQCEVSGIHTVSRDSSLKEIFDASLTHVDTKDVRQSWQILDIDAMSMPPLRETVRKSLSWAKSYRSQKHQQDKENNIVFTSYFTSTEDSQRHRHKKPNRFQYMKDWTLSLKALRMKAVIFHDSLDAGFQHRVSQFYSNISFEYVDSLRNRSTNDARFYAYLRYLESHPDIDRVLMTDLSDVRFQFNPFELMSLLGDDWLYVGTDIDIFPTMRTMQWIHERLRGCYGNASVDQGDLRHLMELDTVYNAGTIGGSRVVVMAALSRIVEYLDLTPLQLNCNMPAVNYAVHKHFYDRVFTGYPLNSRFLRQQATPKGVYIIHK